MFQVDSLLSSPGGGAHSKMTIVALTIPGSISQSLGSQRRVVVDDYQVTTPRPAAVKSD